MDEQKDGRDGSEADILPFNLSLKLLSKISSFLVESQNDLG